MIFLEENDGLIMRRLVDIKPVLRPNTLEVQNEVMGAFHRYVRQQKADDKWQAGLYEGDPTHSGSPSFYEIMNPLVYTGTTSYHDNEEVLDVNSCCLVEIPKHLLLSNYSIYSTKD